MMSLLEYFAQIGTMLREPHSKPRETRTGHPGSKRQLNRAHKYKRQAMQKASRRINRAA